MAFSFLMSLTEDEFKAYLKNSIIEALTEKQSFPTRSKSSEDFLSIKEASEFTHIPVATLYDYTHKKRIPYNKVGKKLLFNRQDLVEWIAQHRRKTVKEIEGQSLQELLKKK